MTGDTHVFTLPEETLRPDDRIDVVARKVH